MISRTIAICTLAVIIGYVTGPSRAAASAARDTGEWRLLQDQLDTAEPGATITCNPNNPLVFAAPLVIRKAVTLSGLHAGLPEAFGGTSLVVVDAEGVTLTNLTLHGNYGSVSQKDRAPLVRIRKGNFTVVDCTFYDSSKDGVEVCPESGKGDIVGGAIRNIKAFRIGRDAVSISGGNEGHKVRNVTIENVRLEQGYLRGAVEVSDGTDNIHVRGVYAEGCPYAVDIQDHRRKSAPNTNILVEDVVAVNCQHIIRTANSPRGHAGLVLNNLAGTNCIAPVRISNTDDVTIEGLRIVEHRSQTRPPVSLTSCRRVNIHDIHIDTVHFQRKPVAMKNCSTVRISKKAKPHR